MAETAVKKADAEKGKTEKKPIVIDARKAANYIFTGLLALLIVRSFLIRPTTIIRGTDASSDTSVTGPAAREFAAAFAREYLTYTSQDQVDYQNRLKPYLASGVDTHAGLIFPANDLNMSEVVTQSFAWSAKPLDPSDTTHAFVTVLATIKVSGLTVGSQGFTSTNPKYLDGCASTLLPPAVPPSNPSQQAITPTTSATPVFGTAECNVFLVVPVEGSTLGTATPAATGTPAVTPVEMSSVPFAVFANPQMLPIPASSGLDANLNIAGTQITDTIKNNITSFLDPFFNAYSSSDDNTIANFVESGSYVHGMQGRYIYVSGSAKVKNGFQMQNDTTEYLVYAQATFTDPISGGTFQMEYFMHLKEESSTTWKVVSM